jgi:hypothetical protein
MLFLQNIIVISEIVCVQVPNFGFVVFDSEEAVEKALASRPIMLEGNHRWGTDREEELRLENWPLGNLDN